MYSVGGIVYVHGVGKDTQKMIRFRFQNPLWDIIPQNHLLRTGLFMTDMGTCIVHLSTSTTNVYSYNVLWRDDPGGVQLYCRLYLPIVAELRDDKKVSFFLNSTHT
jgi:hypothetical protein